MNTIQLLTPLNLKNLSFFKIALFIFLALFTLLILFFSLFLDAGGNPFLEGLFGLVFLVSGLAIPIFFIVKWRKEIKQTGRRLTLISGRFKIWQCAGTVLLLLFFALTFYGTVLYPEYLNDKSIKIDPSEWNPEGWYA